MERRRNERGQIDTTPPITRRMAVLAVSISAPSSPVGVEPTSNKVWLLDLDQTDSSEMPRLRLCGDFVNVANYDPSLSGGTPATIVSGTLMNVPTFVVIQLIGGVWTFAWTGC